MSPSCAAGRRGHRLLRRRHAARPRGRAGQGRACSSPAPSRAKTCGAWARTRSPRRTCLADGPSCSACSTRVASGRPMRSPFLRRFCETGGIDACAVFRRRRSWSAQGGAEIPWNERGHGERRAGRELPGRAATVPYPLLGAVTPLGEHADLRVFIVRLLDDELAQTLSQHVGLECGSSTIARSRPRRSMTSPRCIRPALADGARPCSASTRTISTPRASRCSPRPARRSR